MSPSILTVGTFDGVHRGHQKIFKKVARLAQKTGARPAAITFNIPPRLFFFPSREPSLLTTVQEKADRLKSCGIQKVRVLEFNKSLARISAEKFFEKFILKELGARQIVIGYNFGFGKNREGDPRFLESLGRKHGIKVHVIPPVTFRSVPVSSGKIRDALKAGDLKSANDLLGYSYFLTGKVVPGQKLGAKLGFPTANIAVPPEKITPPGVYAVRVTTPVGKTYGGMCNVGFRPTVAGNGAGQRSVEVPLFGFTGSLYGKTLKVEFVRKLRDEVSFPGLDALRRQLFRDRARAQAFL